MLKTAARTGAKQYVILGAGLDTFAFRELEFAEKYPVFEVDHPLTQAGGEAMQSSFPSRSWKSFSSGTAF